MMNSIGKKAINKLHRDESGQAFTELCISLIPLLAVMLFLIYFAGISISSIGILLKARGNAAENAVNLTQTGDRGSLVRSWIFGHDQEDDSMSAAYIQDDQASGSSYTDDTYFIGEINGNSDFAPSEYVDRIGLTEYAPFSELVGGDLFLDAAKLTSGSASDDTDPVATLRENNVISSEDRAQMDKTFEYLLPGDGLVDRLKNMSQWKSNQVYMPITE